MDLKRDMQTGCRVDSAAGSCEYGNEIWAP